MIQVWYILRIKYSNEYFIFFRLEIQFIKSSLEFINIIHELH